MLYLEDYLEMIESIPQEVRDKTAELRELDMGVQNTSERIEDDIKNFFSSAKRMKTSERAGVYTKIKSDYYKILDDADNKLRITTAMHNQLERYVRKLDQELEKFKCELEADSPGITEILEKKSLELDEPTRDNQKENRYNNVSRNSNIMNNSDWNIGIKKEDSDPNLSSSLSLSPPTSLPYHLGQIGAGSNAIAAAASQAIAATQQMRHGRKTASLVASYDAVSQGILPSDLSIGSELAHAAKAALAASSLTSDSQSCSSSLSSVSNSGSSNKRQKKSQRVAAMRDVSPAPSDDVPQEAVIDPMVENPDWTHDPNEPRYCVCNQISYGNMVACDNPKCYLEWFHYQCVGITAPPKGKWYCPQCASSMNRRQRK